MRWVNFRISTARIERYLDSPELRQVVTPKDDCSHLVFRKVTLAWPDDDESCRSENTGRFVLRDVNLELPRAELTIICGKTGSGKSLLLESLLGEVDLLSGTIEVPRTLPASERGDGNANHSNWIVSGVTAFVGQSPWIENATVKANILFGLPLQPERYALALSACALDRDLEMLPDGDESELGVNGINLSGGQKWRVSLARAVYSRAEILVMDDIFSAVDAHIGRHLFEMCINGDICRARTVIIATHHVGLCLHKARVIVEVADGSAKAVAASAITIGNVLPPHRLADNGSSIPAEQHLAPNRQANAGCNIPNTNSMRVNDGDSQLKTRRKFIRVETRPEGAIRRTVYWYYMTAVGKRWYLWWGLVPVACVALQALILGASFASSRHVFGNIYTMSGVLMDWPCCISPILVAQNMVILWSNG